MAEYRLYRPNESGNAYKATLMPNLCGLDWEPVFIEFFLGDKRTERFCSKATNSAKSRDWSMTAAA
jgi:glutathione S-transferase